MDKTAISERRKSPDTNTYQSSTLHWYHAIENTKYEPLVPSRFQAKPLQPNSCSSVSKTEIRKFRTATPPSRHEAVSDTKKE